MALLPQFGPRIQRHPISSKPFRTALAADSAGTFSRSTGVRMAEPHARIGARALGSGRSYALKRSNPSQMPYQYTRPVAPPRRATCSCCSACPSGVTVVARFDVDSPHPFTCQKRKRSSNAAQKGDNQQPPVGDWPERQAEVIRLYTLYVMSLSVGRQRGNARGAPTPTLKTPRCLDRTMELCRH